MKGEIIVKLIIFQSNIRYTKSASLVENVYIRTLLGEWQIWLL